MRLVPGMRFHPTDVELVRYYLRRKVLGKNLRFHGISVVDIYKYAPWDLPDKCGLKSGDRKWYFFCPREKKYASGTRINRSTELGYWKTTGKDRDINYKNEVVGKIKTLVFHRGKAPNGNRTDWLMHEYRIQDKELDEQGIDVGMFVLCAVFEKDGRGPRNGAQYGALFREEDWTDDDDIGDNLEESNAEIVNYSGGSGPVLEVPTAHISISHPDSDLQRIHVEDSAASCPLETLPSAGPLLSTTDVSFVENEDQLRLVENEDDLAVLLSYFQENDSNAVDLCHNEMLNYCITGMRAEADSSLGAFDIYNDLADLRNVISFPTEAAYRNPNPLESGCESGMPFVELLDLEEPINGNATLDAHCLDNLYTLTEKSGEASDTGDQLGKFRGQGSMRMEERKWMGEGREAGTDRGSDVC